MTAGRFSRSATGTDDHGLIVVIVFALSGLDLSLWFAAHSWFSGFLDAAAPFL